MKTKLNQLFAVLAFLLCQQLMFAQSYQLNGSLGLDTVPQHTLDVNGDGYFKGELLLDDDLRMMKLASGDILIERLVYFDEDGRMHRLGGDGARDLEEYIHNLSCKYGTDGTIFYWNHTPGKIFTFDEDCGAPNVGIGTDNPEARLDVRGTSYFTENMGVGILNQSESRLQVKANTGLQAIEVLNTSANNTANSGHTVYTVNAEGHSQHRVSGMWSDHVISVVDLDTENDDEVFYVMKTGEIKMLNLSEQNYALTAKIKDVDYNNVTIRANGSVDLRLDGNGDEKAITVNNMSLPAGAAQDVFNLRENGTMYLKYIGQDDNQDVFTVRSAFHDGNIFRIDGKGRLLAASVHVRELGNFSFPDYVFEPDYELMPLEKLRRYVADNQRLPNMPSADEVKRNGVDLGEMNRLLVEKVEELTLYVLQLEERLKAVEAK